LSLLQMAPIGVVLLVLTPYTSVCRTCQPVMTVGAAPCYMAMMVWIASAADPGLLFEDMWKPSVLSIASADLYVENMQIAGSLTYILVSTFSPLNNLSIIVIQCCIRNIKK
jgi:hypothetical protein